MAIDNEPKALLATMLSEIITSVKQSRPTRTDGSSTTGFVFAMPRPGQLVSPRDFGLPWSPVGGSPRPSSPAPAPGTTPTPAAQAAAEATTRASQATFNTENLVDSLLLVTDDGTMEGYSGGGRKVSLTYQQILNAMEAPPAPPRPPADQARIDAARKVLYAEDGKPTAAYETYKANAMAYATAGTTSLLQQKKFLADPALSDSTAMLIAPYEQAVTDALQQWRTQGADEIEAAMATIESLGIPLEQGMIKGARDAFTAWNLSVLGVPGAKAPYAYVLPSEWALIDVDDIGWTTLEMTSNEYHQHFASNGYKLDTGAWRGDASSTSVGADLDVLGFGFSGSYNESDASHSSSFSTNGSNGTQFHNDAKDLHVKLQYGLCEIVRPWLLTDLFHMQNWYVRGGRKHCISDGTIANQLGEKAGGPLLPMIPTHFLVVRNVEMSASDWGSDSATLSTWFSSAHSQDSSSQSGASGGAEVPVFGCLSLGGSYCESQSHEQGSFTDESGHARRSDYGGHFANNTLSIQGAQILGWLGEIVPACPPMDDPTLGQPG